MNLRAKLRILCAVTLTAGAFAMPASAEEEIIQLDTVVVTAAGYEQKITDAPASISVITREELDRKPYITLLDAVRDIEGVDVGETTDKTGQGTISIRGMGSDYTLIMIDGKRQNNVGALYPNSFSGNQFNHIPPLSMVERIEVIRGPMSTLYGADAIGGVINIITKKVSDVWTGSASVSRTFEENSDFGNDRTADFSIMGPIFQGKLGLGLRGSIYERDASNPTYSSVTDPAGEVHSRSLGFGGGGRTVDNTNWNLGARLTFTPNKAHEFIFDIETSNQKYDNTNSQLGTLDDYGSILRASNAGIVQPRVGYFADQEFTRDQYSITHNGDWGIAKSQVIFSYVETENLGRSLPFTVEERADLQALWDAACIANGDSAGCGPNSLFPNSDASKRGNNASEDAKLEILQNLLTDAQMQELLSYLPRQRRTMETRQYTFDAKVDVPVGDHYFVFGGQYIDAEMEDGVFGMYGGGYRDGTAQEHRQWALFAEDNWKIFQFLTLTGGIRYDDHNIFGGQFSPRIYAVADVAANWTVKGGVSTGYKAPQTSDLFPGITGFGGQGVNPMVGTPDLEPETSVNSELAIYYTNPAGHNFNATVFMNDFKDKIASGDNVPNCEVAAPGERCVDIGEGWADLGYTSFSQRYNIDKAEVKGLELAGKLKLLYGLALRGNYTYTDSEQKSGNNKGQPLTGYAKHMANATLDWYATPKLMLFFTAEMRDKRYRSWDSVNNRALYYKDYTIFHLGGSYKLADNITLHARINNLFDKDFTSYKTTFTDNGDGTYTPTYTDDYNVKAKSRNLWVALNVEF